LEDRGLNGIWQRGSEARVKAEGSESGLAAMVRQQVTFEDALVGLAEC
jgi:hypothetical protein